MSRTKHFAVLSLILIISMILFKGCESKPDIEKLESEIHDLLTSTIKLFNTKDLDGLVNRFTEDGTLKITNNPIVVGHNALRANYEKNLQLENFNISLNVIKINISKAGDMAFVLSDYSVSFDIPIGKFQDEGITLLALQRVNDEWKISAENLSSNGQVQ